MEEKKMAKPVQVEIEEYEEVESSEA